MDSGKERGIMTIVISLTPKHPAAAKKKLTQITRKIALYKQGDIFCIISFTLTHSEVRLIFHGTHLLLKWSFMLGVK